MWDVLDVYVWDTCAWRGSAGGCVCWTWVCGGHVCVWDTHVHGKDVQDHRRVLNTCACGRDVPGAHVCVYGTCVCMAGTCLEHMFVGTRVQGTGMSGAHVCVPLQFLVLGDFQASPCSFHVEALRAVLTPGEALYPPVMVSKSHHNTRKTE